MRVTNKMLSHSFLRDMKYNLDNMRTLQQQLTSGKEIRKPSDNPFKAARAMQLHTDINANKQYKENISDTINWLDTTDTALGQAGDVLQRVRELMLAAGNAGYSQNERQAIKDEINEKVGELSQILNTNFDGKYVFGGTRGTSKPLSTGTVDGNTALIYAKRMDDGTPLEDEYELDMLKSKLQVEISQGVTMEYNVTANEILEFKNESGEDCNLMEQLKAIVAHLDGRNYTSDAAQYDDTTDTTYSTPLSAVTGKDLKGITDALNNLLRVRSEIGAKQNRMDSAKEKNIDESFNMTEILAHTEDIDITEKTMEYATMQTVYIASLQTSARVLQPSLIDYLR